MFLDGQMIKIAALVELLRKRRWGLMWWYSVVWYGTMLSATPQVRVIWGRYFVEYFSTMRMRRDSGLCGDTGSLLVSWS